MKNIAVFGSDQHPRIVELTQVIGRFAEEHGVRLHLLAGRFADWVISESTASCVWYGCATPPGPQQKVPTPPSGADTTHHISSLVDPRSPAKIRLPQINGLVVVWVTKQEHVIPVILTYCQGVLITGSSPEIFVQMGEIWGCLKDSTSAGNGGVTALRVASVGWSPEETAGARRFAVERFDRHVQIFRESDLEAAFASLLEKPG